MPAISPDVLLWLVPALVAAAALAPAIAARTEAAGWILALVPAVGTAILCAFIPDVAAGDVLTAAVDWAPRFDVRYALMVDGLSLTFGLLVLGIGALVMVYSGGYMRGQRHRGRFLSLMLLFMAAMLGLVLADDLVTLFIFYELTSIASFLLIGFEAKDRAARRGALQALVVTSGGGLLLFVSLVMMRVVTGEATVTGLFSDPDAIRASDAYGWIASLTIAAAFTKSAQVPFHSWLPNAMAAPTPVSAYLHSATMVKAGVFVLMRFFPVLGETVVWETVLPLFGGATLVVGVLLALAVRDMKLVLAYSTVASLGLLVLLVGVGTHAALGGAALYLVAHAFFKGGLFMVAGAVDHATGTRHIDELGGLASRMPLSFAAAILACLSMAGFLPFLGFVAKEAAYKGLWHQGGLDAATITAVTGNALMVAVAAVVLLPFIRPGREAAKEAHEASAAFLAGPLVLAALGLISALSLEVTMRAFLTPMTEAIAGESVDLGLHLVPKEFSPPVILSVVTIGAGVVLALLSGVLRWLVDRVTAAIGWGPDRGFDQALGGLLALGWRAMRLVQPGMMQIYLRVMFAALAVALIVPLVVGGVPMPRPQLPHKAIDVAILAAAVIGLVVVVFTRRRLVAVVSLGLQGTMVAVVFLVYGGPDLALTQFMVEALSVIILALVMTRLDLAHGARRSTRGVSLDAGIAIACGAGFTVLLLGVVAGPFDSPLARFTLAFAEPLAHGANVVNVVLTDFRALDTLGEIGVVLAAGLAALLVLSAGGGADGEDAARGDHVIPRTDTIILRTVARYLALLMAVFSAFVLLRGHNELGGGFSGGLILTSAAAVYGIAFGTRRAREAIAVDPHAVAGVGLLLAALAGLSSALAGEPFLTGLHASPTIGGLTLPVSNILVFDIGVYLVVFGSFVSLILSLEGER